MLIASTRGARSAPVVTPTAPAEQTYKPAVSARRSLSSPKHISSLIDGNPYKTLKRHLAGHGLTPVKIASAAIWPLTIPWLHQPPPSTAVVAKTLGLGRKPGDAESENMPSPAPSVEVAPTLQGR